MVCTGAVVLGLLAVLGAVVLVRGGGRRRRAAAGPTPQPAPPRPASWWLVFVQGPGAGQSVALRDEVVLGRHSDTDVRIADDQVSRRHALIQRQGDAYVLSDLRSRNGTYLNGERLAGPAYLRDGDTIGIGRALLRLDGPQG